MSREGAYRKGGPRNSARKRRGGVYKAIDRNQRTQPLVGTDALRCGYCRKRNYDSRAAAKHALRVLHPGQVGVELTAYRCERGGQGWHVGHRRPTEDEET